MAAEGPEHVSFVAAAPGNYRISRFHHWIPTVATIGRFKITILELRPGNEQELKTSKNLEVVKAKGIALLAEIEETIPQIKSPHTRISSQLQVAQAFVWEIDEKRASKYLADAVAGLKEFIASVDTGSASITGSIQPSRNCVTRSFKSLATRDPDAALRFPELQQSDKRSVRKPARPLDTGEPARTLDRRPVLIPKDPARALEDREAKSQDAILVKSGRHSFTNCGGKIRRWPLNWQTRSLTKLLNEKLLIKNPEAAESCNRNLVENLSRIRKEPFKTYREPLPHRLLSA